METPPSPFYEVPICFFSIHFLSEKNMILKGVLKVLQGVYEKCSQQTFNFTNNGFP